LKNWFLGGIYAESNALSESEDRIAFTFLNIKILNFF